ncbi:MAG: SDR family NAD(P)-dependent oxidoreductase [Candidatus Nanopelagicales bacterium]
MNAPRTVVITGASDGIGRAAAQALHQRGDAVVIVGRSPEKTAAVAAELGVESHVADFAEFAQVRQLAADLLDRHERIDVLANNAGGVMGKRSVTIDGHELTIQVNHLAPFLLTNLLLPRLIESRAAVINTSSMASARAKLNPDNLDLAEGYSPFRAYAAAKLANILFTRELVRRHGEQGIGAASLHPGVVGTNFGATGGAATKWLYRLFGPRLMKSPEQGANTLVWLAATHPGTDWVSGEHYDRRRISKVNPLAADPELARRLWEVSERFTGLV